MYYISVFFIFSLIGFFYEHALSLLTFLDFHSGFFYGPWIPIYGFGILLILAVNKYLKSKNLVRGFEMISFFFIIAVVLTILEFIGGHIIYFFTKEVYWDYSWAKFHYGKYISLEVAFIWGTLATLINYYVYPHIEKHIKKLPNWITIIVLISFIIDAIITFITK